MAQRITQPISISLQAMQFILGTLLHDPVITTFF
jgi:hypothetical protein